MQFQVPQFIEIEDKIFGPFTFKQFLYLTGGAGLCFIFYAYLPKFIAFIPIAGTVVFSGALAFYKYNGRPFSNLLESFVKYTFTSKLYIWRKDPKKLSTQNKVESESTINIEIPKLSESKLKDLSWSLDVKDSIKSQDYDYE